MGVTYKEAGGWEVAGVVEVGEQAEGALSLLLGRTSEWCCVLSRWQGCMYTNHRIDQDGHWQQLGIQKILISAPQWPHRPCNAPTWLYSVDKKPFVKSDLAIYSQVVGASGQCMIVSLILGFNFDFSFWSVLINPVTYVTYVVILLN